MIVFYGGWLILIAGMFVVISWLNFHREAFKALGVLVFLLLVGVGGIALYMLPTIIALCRKHPKSLAIFVLNFLSGWTFVGWVAGMVWAFT